VVVHDTRDHIAGNAHTERDRSGVMIHQYGPHIFHTGSRAVWEYVCRHTVLMPFTLRVRSTARGSVYSLPVNLATINQAFHVTLTPDEARARVEADRVPCEQPANFEEAALASIGPTLYELLFRGYTLKQWGRDPRELPASVFRRLPIRFTYDDNYFDHTWQGIPKDGYTAMVASILEHPQIQVKLGAPYPRHAGYDHTIWTGPLDAWFDHRFGRLGYRTLSFLRTVSATDLQGCPVMNYPDENVPWTRITEHKHFAPWERHDYSVGLVEFSREAGADDEPYYPIRLADDESTFDAYQRAARTEPGVTFAGRLGTYRYLDMDVAIAEALTAAAAIKSAAAAHQPIPPFAYQENHEHAHR
jgi:UDP-galactopyranose mutase